VIVAMAKRWHFDQPLVRIAGSAVPLGENRVGNVRILPLVPAVGDYDTGGSFGVQEALKRRANSLDSRGIDRGTVENATDWLYVGTSDVFSAPIFENIEGGS
jgi:hypothetical protein